MQASSQRTTGQVRLALMLIIGVVAAAACVLTLMWWKAPVASAQDEGGDPTGRNFVVSCGFTGLDKRRAVDPIADRGNPTSFHSHDFFGNTTTNENSTFETLRAAASQPDHGTTCEPKPGTEFGDTAAYWIPTVSWTDSRGKTALEASNTFFYYRAGLKDPASVQPFPALDTNDPPDGQVDDGLKIITVQGKNVEWRCQNGDWSTRPPTRCENGTLVVRIFFPDCLDVARNPETGQPIIDPTTGKQIPLLDSPDHRSHMVAATSAGCPSTHPYPVPRLQTNFLFKHTVLTKRGTVTLSSGDYRTMHADYFNAWQEGTLEDLVARCINAGPFTARNPKPIDCQ